MKGSLRRKLIIFLLAATVLPISISMFITYRYTTHSISEQAIQENSKLLFQGKTNLKNYFDLFNKLSLSVYNDMFLNTSSLFLFLRDGLSGDNAGYKDEMMLSSILRNMAKTHPDIYQIRLYMVKGNKTYLWVPDLVRSAVNTVEPADGAASLSGPAYMQASHLSHTYGLNEREKFPYYVPKPVITLHRPIFNVPLDEQIGFISIDIKLDYIRSIGEMLNTGGGEEFWLLNGRGDVVYSSDERTIGTALNEDWAHRILSGQAPSGQFELKSETFNGIVVYNKLSASYMDWTLVKRIPYSNLYSGARQLTRINSLVLACFLLVSVLATISISYQITRPIKRLIRSIQAMQTGNLQADIPIDTEDEIGIFARRFRQLMNQINGLILREFRLELANKTNQLKALQAQVHPHFLNNALQSIGTLALQHQDRKIYDLISSLGKLMRYHMNTEESVVPLSREIEHVKAYAELQKQRFGDSLDVRFDISPEAAGVAIPKMIVQPLVENVFKHGVTRADAPIEIRIACRIRHSGILQLRVEDNGSGMDPALMAILQEQLDQADSGAASPREDHVGLANVLMRLRLFFSDRASLKLIGKEGGGLIVDVSIPIAEGGSAA